MANRASGMNECIVADLGLSEELSLCAAGEHRVMAGGTAVGLNMTSHAPGRMLNRFQHARLLRPTLKDHHLKQPVNG